MASIPTPHKKKFYRRWWFWALLIIGLIIVAAIGTGIAGVKAKQSASLSDFEDTATISQHTVERTVSATGQIVVDASQTLVPTSVDVVKAVGVHDGADVADGEAIVSFESGSELTAPFDGRVLQLNAFVGQVVTSASPVAVIGYRSSHIEWYASDAEAVDLVAGQLATVSVPAINGGRKHYSAQVQSVATQKSVSSIVSTNGVPEAGYLVKVSTGDMPAALTGRIGLSVDMDITVFSVDSAVSIERSAIHYNNDNQAFVYLAPTIDNSFKAKVKIATSLEDVLDTQIVTTGKEGDQYVEITDGIASGTDVLLYLPDYSFEPQAGILL